MLDLTIADKIVSKYDNSVQDLILIEEMSELTKELLKQRRGKHNRPQILEEMAHTYISLKVVQTILEIDDQELQEYIAFKEIGINMKEE